MKKQDIHWKFSIKEFMLLVGVLVAIIILFTLWLNPIAEYSNVEVPLLPLPNFQLPSTEKILMEIAEGLHNYVR
jgi:hypothetical protein